MTIYRTSTMYQTLCWGFYISSQNLKTTLEDGWYCPHFIEQAIKAKKATELVSVKNLGSAPKSLVCSRFHSASRTYSVLQLYLIESQGYAELLFLYIDIPFEIFAFKRVWKTMNQHNHFKEDLGQIFSKTSLVHRYISY